MVKNLGLVDPNIDAGTGHLVGSLIGGLYTDSVSNCFVEGGSVSGNKYIGGLIGVTGTFWSAVTNCYSMCSVLGSEGIGGLVGDNGGQIQNCYSIGSVSGNTGVGGLVGHNVAGSFGAASIWNCYAKGSVSGDDNVGGLVGSNIQSAMIRNCYSTGSASGNSNVGGLVGSNGNLAPDSFWDTETSEQSNSAGGLGRTTAQMKTESTFTDYNWDFIEIWNIGENQTYPYLRVYPVGELNHDSQVNFPDFATLANHWLAGGGE